MRIETVRIDVDSEVRLYGFGDWHVGSANCDMGLLYETRRRILDEGAYWVMMGDAAECITPKDPRWASGGIDRKLVDARGVDFIVDRQVEWIREFVAPIIDRCLVWHQGNHERKYSEYSGHNPIVEGVLAHYGKASLWCEGSQNTVLEFFHDGSPVGRAVVNSAHGNKTGQFTGSIVHWQMNRLRTYDDVSVLMRGHHHHLFAVKVANIHTTKSKKPRLKDRVAVILGTGSALKTLEENSASYAEIADYPPVVLGFPYVRFVFENGKMRMEATS